MFTRIRRGLTFANVCSVLALVIALGTGTAYAANTVFSEDIVDGEVKAVDIHSGAVITSKIHEDAVNTSKVLDGTLTADDLGTSSVGADEIATDAVGSDEIATDAVNATEIADDSIDTGEIVDNSLFSSDLGANSVGSSELQANAIDGTKVVNNSLTTADIAGADVNGGHISIGANSVPNGRCKSFELSIGGAHAGEAVVVSTQAALQEGILLYGARVPSDGHVTMLLCNFSGTTQSALTSFPIRVITFG